MTKDHNDLSKDMWQHIKQHGFFGLVIPKKYGGHGFSALAHSEILAKLLVEVLVLPQL